MKLKNISETVNKDELFKKVWNLSADHCMDVVLMMFSHAEGTTLLGTHKLEQFIVTTELCRFPSMMFNRPPLYRPALDCTVANDFISTEFERYIDLVEDNAYELSSAPNSEVLVIIANNECRKFIFASPRLRPYIMSKECISVIERCLGKGTFSAGQESDMDK
ncbi:uncharacterized protein LOC114131482 [Aphis gossypii]|uniref:Uncharacterized protein n=2 Tax=Aphis TaxID=464929 RepID=A0A9P0NQ50_APHGO|nr:uncharacterized protein LOC114131482 [Aphis gossypii]CAH1737483.1 unnamed protein product [Aphis gossypii]